MNNKRKTLIVGLALAGVLALGGAALAMGNNDTTTTTAFAQEVQVERPFLVQDDLNEDNLDEAAPEAETGPRARRGGNSFFDRDAMKAVVADALGITVEELEAAHEAGQRLPELAEELGVDIETVEAAVQAAREEAINQAVEDGTITQEQADQILSGEGRNGFGHGHNGRRGGNSFFDREAMQTVVADALGITVEELEAAHEAGQRLPELAEELGIDIETVEAAVQTAREEAINQAVEDGTITQEQADQILSGEGRGGRFNAAAGIIDKDALKATAAEALGITVEELDAAREAGQRLPELAEELGVDIETVQEAVEAAKAEMVQQAVEDGTITQEQADQILSGEGRRGFGNGRDGRRGGPRFNGPQGNDANGQLPFLPAPDNA